MPRGRLVPVSDPPTPPVREAVEATDWDEYAVLDVVTFLPATSRGLEDDRQRVETYRYRARAPPIGTYENGERSFRVRRVTERLSERLSE